MTLRQVLGYITLIVLLAGYAYINPLRVEHWILLGIVAVLMLWSSRTRDLAVTLAPLVLFGFIYDLMRLAQVRAWDAVSVETIYHAEQAVFGWMTPEPGDLGPLDFFREHHHIVFDALGGLWYATHMPSAIVFGLYLWWRSRRQTERGVRPQVDFSGDVFETDGPSTKAGETRKRLHVFYWGFLVVSIIGLVIQAIFPVAPPWYVEHYGMEPPGEPIVGHPGALERIDAYIGIDYFAGVYAKAAYIFGAMPSLHVASPTWLALNIRHRALRAGAWIYALLMGVFAVYLGHHYILDIIAGMALSVGVYLVLTRTALQTWPSRVDAFIYRVFIDESDEGWEVAGDEIG